MEALSPIRAHTARVEFFRAAAELTLGGARPLRDAVEKYVGDAVVRDLIAGGTGSGELAVDAGRERLRVG